MVFELANYAEAALWALIGLTFVMYAVRRAEGVRRRCILTALTFLVFSLSDVIEVQSGAWWRPWWLLVLKGTCVAALLALLTDHFISRRRQSTPRHP
jgi:hypothetical protein